METEGPRSMEKSLGKKININAASLVDLKAELFKRKEQFKRERGGRSLNIAPKAVSEKTASIWLKQKPNKPTKRVPLTKASEVPSLTDEEEKQLAKSRAALEAKAALYEKLTKRENLPEEEEDNPYLVDFQQKYVDKNLKCNRTEVKLGNDTPQESSNSEDSDWVEYTDAFGRSRKCLRKDLPELEEIDNKLPSKRSREGSPLLDLMSDDMVRERERQRWEEEAYEELGEESGPIHYQDVQHNEVRTHGVAYYQFATDEEKRKEQMAALNKLRDQTIEQRQKREKLREKRKSLAEARLRKIKARKLGLSEEEVAALEEAASDLPQETKEEEKLDKKEQEVAAKLAELEDRLKHTKHVRPWDKGKIVDPIKKRKKELEDERLPEFAPPASYYKNEKPASSNELYKSPLSCNAIYNDSACNTSLNATPDQHENVHQPFQLPPLFSHPTSISSTPPYFSSSSSSDTFTGTTTNRIEGVYTNSVATEGESDSLDSSVQKSDDSIRRSVTELLQYYKSKSALHE